MSWINDEANANNERETSEAQREALIQQSQFWGRLVRQVEADVKTINEHDYWKKKLAGFPLRFGESPNGLAYQVSKSGNPSVTVQFQNLGDRIVIERGFHENSLSSNFLRKEELSVATSGNNVVLVNVKKEAFIVPEEASQYILKAIVESLKITPSAP